MNEYREGVRRFGSEARWTGWYLGCTVIAVFTVVLVPLGILFGWFGEAASVAREQFGPRAAVRKYEWFRDAAAQLEKKRADIVLFTERAAKAEARATTGDRTDRERAAIADAEAVGVIASYNTLAAEYNAASEKFNWAPFAGDPLPQTVQPYQKGK